MKKQIVLLLILSLTIIFTALMGSSALAEDQARGTLSVMTTPVGGAIYIDLLLKGKRFWSGSLDAGYHVVTFGEVEGYISPSAQTVTVIADETSFVVGAYRKFPSD